MDSAHNEFSVNQESTNANIVEIDSNLQKFNQCTPTFISMVQTDTISIVVTTIAPTIQTMDLTIAAFWEQISILHTQVNSTIQ